MSKFIKNILSFIISLMLMFVILATSFTVFFKGTILNPETYIKIIEKNEIHHEIYKNIYSNIDYFVLTNNMPEDTLDGVISKDEIKQITNNYIYYTIGFMKGEDYEIESVDMEVYESRINTKIDKFLKSNTNDISDEFKNNIGYIKTKVLNIVKNDLEIINLNELSKSSTLQHAARVTSILNSNKLIMGMFGTIIIISLLFFIIWIKRKVRRYAWIGYSFISSGIVVLLIGLTGYISGFYDNLPIGIPYLATAVSLIVQKCLLNLTFIGFIILVIGLCFMSVYWHHLYKRHEKKMLKLENVDLE